MLVDARDIPRDTTLRASIAIIGAGAAGISLAKELLATGLSVLVLESGGLSEEADTEALSRATMDGDILDSPFWPPEYHDKPSKYYLARSRRRYLGGATNAWGGWCCPFNPLDFAARDWIPGSGWPLGKTDLDPYYRRAAALCEVSPFAADTYHAGWEGRRALPTGDLGLRTRVIYQSPPTRFGVVYRGALLAAKNVTVCTHANVTELETTPQADRVTRARVQTLGGNRLYVEADRFVLSMGGVENARLLLLSNSVRPEGLGNGNDLVGRCYMDHCYMAPGYLVALTDPTAFGLYEWRHEESLGHPVLGILCLDEDVQRRERLQNVWFGPGSPGHLKGYAYQREDLAVPEVLRACDPGSGLDLRLISFTAFPEHTPNRASRVTLDSAVDALGCRRAKVDWRMNPSDSASVRRSFGLLARALARRSMGRVRMVADEQHPYPRAWGGTHHSGTTRMSSDPRQGVVDADCRLHEVGNLYAVGGSVFPTLGPANPTLTIVALAVRLADHLRAGLS